MQEMPWQEEMGQHAKAAPGEPPAASQAAEDRLARHVGSQEPDPEMEAVFFEDLLLR